MDALKRKIIAELRQGWQLYLVSLFFIFAGMRAGAATKNAIEGFTMGYASTGNLFFDIAGAIQPAAFLLLFSFHHLMLPGHAVYALYYGFIIGSGGPFLAVALRAVISVPAVVIFQKKCFIYTVGWFKMRYVPISDRARVLAPLYPGALICAVFLTLAVLLIRLF